MGRVLLAALALGAGSGCADYREDETGTGIGAADEAFYRTIDPVTGEQVGTDTPHRLAHGGRTYYFASERSLNRFGENPSAYVDNDGRYRADWGRERREAR